MIELKKLMLSTKSNLSDIHVPVTAIYSTRDEVVSIESLATLKAGLTQTTVEEIVLTESLHAYYPEYEQGIIEHALLRLCGITPSEQTENQPVSTFAVES